MEQLCDEYLTSGDSAILLVAISERVSNRDGLEDVSNVLLLDKYQLLLAQLGWDLISLVIPRLPPTESRGWELLRTTTTLCSPKEMCLALLEQMAQLNNIAVFFKMMKPLQAVVLKLRPVAVVSTLKEVAPLVSAALRGFEGQRRLMDNAAGEEAGESGDEEGSGEVEAGTTLDEDLACNGLLLSIEFVARFVDLSEALTEHKTLLQSQCSNFLLSIMGYPLISMKHKMATPICSQIMHQVVRCRVGAFQLLQGEGLGDGEGSPPALGVAFFAYLLLVDHMEQSYLPMVIRKDYLLHVVLTHVKTLLQRSESRVMLKGLALLTAVLVPAHSLNSTVLDDPQYVDTAELLCRVIVNCPHKTLRERSMKMLLDFINLFDTPGTHKLYKSLCHSVKHSGLLGLLIFHIKNEVDAALRGGGVGSPFLGHSLVPLLDMMFVVRDDEDLLTDSDRIMGALNFLRFLLIRDKPGSNHTTVWSQASSLVGRFTDPLRRALYATKMHAREEIAKAEQSLMMMKSAPQDGDPAPVLTVEVSGEVLPGVSPKDELQALHAALQRLDMIECVLVRVEELLETAAK
ncbi:hypothetical protein EMCRGX_G020327 [Ephydatia muelleri]